MSTLYAKTSIISSDKTISGLALTGPSYNSLNCHCRVYKRHRLIMDGSKWVHPKKVWMEEILHHLWWLKPQKNNRINHLPTGAGFLPSTVCLWWTPTTTSCKWHAITSRLPWIARSYCESWSMNRFGRAGNRKSTQGHWLHPTIIPGIASNHLHQRSEPSGCLGLGWSSGVDQETPGTTQGTHWNGNQPGRSPAADAVIREGKLHGTQVEFGMIPPTPVLDGARTMCSY